jgi:hypothetical protein
VVVSNPLVQHCCQVFVSYARADRGRSWFEPLQTHLRGLEKSRVIDLFIDERIHAGSVWPAEIQQELRDADIVLLLVSAAFLASDFISDVEVPCAMTRSQAGVALVIPIICEPCAWEDSPWGTLQAFPTGGPKGIEPLSRSSDLDSTLTQLIRHLRAAAAASPRRTPEPMISLGQLAADGTLERPIELQSRIKPLLRVVRQSTLQHVVLIGPPGIGKRSMVNELAFWQLTEKRLYRAVIAEAPPARSVVELVAATGPERRFLHIDSSERHRVSFIAGLEPELGALSKVDNVALILTLLPTELGSFGALVSRVFGPDPPRFTQFRLSEASADDAVRMVLGLSSRRGLAIHDDAAHELVELAWAERGRSGLARTVFDWWDRAAAHAEYVSSGSDSQGVITLAIVRKVGALDPEKPRTL